ncbi:MAG: hypothetical protein H0T46_13095, partial [Deltaproteobacteria bacterium]|nr:hypothetical protein [Deltaproteobacteria bacterium]
MKPLLLLSLLGAAACGTHTVPAAQAGEKPVAPTAPSAATPANQTSSVVRAGGRTVKIEAPHGGAITTLAVTPD